MVQYGFLLVVVVMKINRNKVVPPSVGVCGGECQEVRVQICTDLECPGVHNVFGYYSRYLSHRHLRRADRTSSLLLCI